MKVRLILAGLLLAQLADATTFALGIHHVGIGAEANGWARELYQRGGVDAVLGVKLATIVLTLGILVLSAYRYPRIVVMGGATATSLGLVGAVSNSLSVAFALI
jgi:hypothetical protein